MLADVPVEIMYVVPHPSDISIAGGRGKCGKTRYNETFLDGVAVAIVGLSLIHI